MAIGNNTLALVIAAASVLALTSEQVLSLLAPRNSQVELFLENTSGDEIAFIARNEGKMGGVVALNSFSIAIPDIDQSEVTIGIPPQGHYVGPNTEQRVVFASYPNMPHYICQHLRDQDFFAQFGEFDWDMFDAEDRSVLNFAQFFAMNEKLQCSVNVDVVDSNQSGQIGPLGLGNHIQNMDLSCDQVRWVSDCLSMVMTIQITE